MRSSWQTETGHLACRWSEVGQRVEYNSPWMAAYCGGLPRESSGTINASRFYSHVPAARSGIARKLCRPESGTVEGNRSHFKFPLVLGAMLLLAIALASER